jgi:hypothetical protein
VRERLTRPWLVAIWVLAVVVGVVFSLVSSHTLQVIGFLIVVAAVFAAVRPGLSGWWRLGRSRSGDPGLADDTLKNMGLRERGPEYAEEAGTPSTDLWAREQQRYAEHDAERRSDAD